MRCSRSSGAKPWLKAVAGLVLSVLGVPASAGDRAQNLTLPGNKDFILQIDLRDRLATLAVHASVAGAFHRLRLPACQEVLSDFTDRSGRALKENLLGTGQAPQEYLGLLGTRTARTGCPVPDLASWPSPRPAGGSSTSAAGSGIGS